MILIDVDALANDITSCYEIVVTELCDDVLLLDHLNLLDDYLEVDERQIVEVLKEHPESSHCRSIDDLHQLRYIHVLVALEALISHMALVSELFEDISCVLMALVASE